MNGFFVVFLMVVVTVVVAAGCVFVYGWYRLWCMKRLGEKLNRDFFLYKEDRDGKLEWEWDFKEK